MDSINLKPGEIMQVGKKLYGRCACCDKIVCLNKPIIGSLHFCRIEKESHAVETERRQASYEKGQYS
jgi:hypothetical protein